MRTLHLFCSSKQVSLQHRWTSLALCMWILLLGAGCSSNQVNPQPNPRPQLPIGDRYRGPVNHPVSTTGCGKSPQVQPGTSATIEIPEEPAIANGGHTRLYVVHIPRIYSPVHPQAVVLVLHGAGGTAVGTDQGSGFSTLADQQDFLAVYPQGLLAPVGTSFWASEGPMDEGIDDTRFLSDVLDDLQKNFCVDAQRIYETGHSNGGIMSWFLACRLAGRIAAFAPMSGVSYSIPGGCHPGRAVPLLEIHGSADPVEPYNGHWTPAWPAPPIPEVLQTWAIRNGCHLQPEIFLQQADVMAERWSQCQQNADIVHYLIIGGGHGLPPLIAGRTVPDITWGFFQAHPLPSTT